MPVTININNLTLCHKGSNGISTATLPDVCKTPSPGGPVPIPYPNIAFSMDLMKGTTTVKADGGMMCAHYGSEFFKSTGDEPGVAGGVVSSTFIKEATWMMFSFDVKLQGKAACRLTDKMFHNHQNTVNMSGLRQKKISTGKWDMDCLLKILCKDDKDIVAKARKLEVTKATVVFDDQTFTNGKWVKTPWPAGGSASGNKIVIAENATCEAAASTVQHEVTHTEQPPGMDWGAAEVEAYTKGEEWAIKRGLPGRPSLRTIDASGKTVVNPQAVNDLVYKKYPVGITNKQTRPDGEWVKDNGLWRKAKDGDSIAGPQRLTNAQKIDPKEFKCP